MNNEEAKFILQGYRPDGADAGDATFCAALEQTKRDPVLGEWFARMQAFDGAVAAKLAQIRPPAELRAAILAGGKVTEPAASARPWWRHPAWMGAAAGVAMLLAVGVALWPSRAEALSQFALTDARENTAHGGHGHGSGDLQAMFNNPATRLGQPMALDFTALHETGCRTLDCEGHHVLEVCFSRNGVWFHAYVARKADFPGAARQALKISDHGGASLATWADDEHVFVVVSKSGRKNLEALL
jgi:hypothetical protein